jgi:NO-binding membrane sensor protein with MHYT domain
MAAFSSAAENGSLRELRPEWNIAMFAASIGISFLGAFTSTQLMCQARMSRRFQSVLLWSILASLIFGFCSIWSLHEVAMLAFEFDLPIGVDTGLTILSSILAVSFTFIALSSDLLWERYTNGVRRVRHKRQKVSRRRKSRESSDRKSDSRVSAPLLETFESDSEEELQDQSSSDPPTPTFPSEEHTAHSSTYHSPSISSSGSTKRLSSHAIAPRLQDDEEAAIVSAGEGAESFTGTTSDYFSFRRSSTSSGSIGLGSALDFIYMRTTEPAKNVIMATAGLLYAGSTCKNIGKGFAWSLAITSMHYVGIFALQVPSGFLHFNIWLVLLSGLISWTVCTVGCILMAQMETHLPQQILFSVMAAAGVAAMHFTGMRATTFYTTAAPSDIRGYPPALANAVVAIAFVTCIAANVLLAHSATVSRMKLAEIVSTRKALWKTIALKETAEAAARARSDFIASASHEIRTPLHHLQGYSDLLAHTELTVEGRALLTSIQRATKTLSLSKFYACCAIWKGIDLRASVTNNVLDWSKFERDSESSYRPTALDLRAVCESIIVLLPNLDDESRVQLFVVVAPNVPKSLFLDEMYIHRILMNLLSNALVS